MYASVFRKKLLESFATVRVHRTGRKRERERVRQNERRKVLMCVCLCVCVCVVSVSVGVWVCVVCECKKLEGKREWARKRDSKDRGAKGGRGRKIKEETKTEDYTQQNHKITCASKRASAISPASRQQSTAAEKLPITRAFLIFGSASINPSVWVCVWVWVCVCVCICVCHNFFIYDWMCLCRRGGDRKKGKKEWLAGAMKDERKKREKRFILWS